MYANAQGFLDDFTASRTHLAGVVRGYLRHRSASFFRFAGQDLGEGRPRCISDAFGQMTVLDHALNVEVFNSDEVVFVHEFAGDFMGIVPSLVSDMSVKHLQFSYRFTSAVRTFLSASYFALQASQLLLCLAKVLRWSEELPIRSCDQLANAQIKTDVGPCGFKEDRHEMNKKAGVVFPGLALDDCGLNVTVNRSVQFDLDVADMLNVKGFIFDADAVVIGELYGVKPAVAFETGIPWCLPRPHSTKEGLERLVQSAQSALARSSIGLLVIFVRLSLYGMDRALRIIRHRFFSLFPRDGSFSKSAVIDIAMRLKHNVNRSCLFIAGV